MAASRDDVHMTRRLRPDTARRYRGPSAGYAEDPEQVSTTVWHLSQQFHNLADAATKSVLSWALELETSSSWVDNASGRLNTAMPTCISITSTHEYGVLCRPVPYATRNCESSIHSIEWRNRDPRLARTLGRNDYQEWILTFAFKKPARIAVIGLLK